MFFVPGGLLFQAVKGSHGNADLPLMAVFSLFVYAAVGVFVVKTIVLLERATSDK